MAEATLHLEYVPLSQALQWDWLENPKQHDIGGLCEAIQRYGFRDPPEYDATLGAFAQGNGRVKALHWMFRQDPEAVPRYIGVTEDGEWAVPVLMGGDSGSRLTAQAYALDANNLVLTGGDAELWDLLALYDLEQLQMISTAIGEAGQDLVTMDGQSLDFARPPEEVDEPPDDSLVTCIFLVNYEGSAETLAELELLLGPYFMPRSKRKLNLEFFIEMVRSYCSTGKAVVIDV